MVGMSLVGHIPSNQLRGLIYRHLFRVRLSSGATIYRRCEIWAPSLVSIGARSKIGQDTFLDGRLGITIGEDVAISSEVMVWTLEHDPQNASFNCRGGSVRIGDKVWIGARAILLPGVSVGDGAVIAAAAVVSRDVEPYTVVAGNPARRVSQRNPDLAYEIGSAVPFV
jgi:acetyltransferase-like isoleucine patch superfamily enzyme